MEQVIVKTYRGREKQATAAFRKDAAIMAAQGYFPTSQNYSAGSYGCGSFLLAALLCFVLIGIIVFIYMLIVKPAGVLTVTYEHRAKEPLASPPPPQLRFFLFVDGEVRGPYDRATIVAMRSSGQINGETSCCVEGSEDWKPLAVSVS